MELSWLFFLIKLYILINLIFRFSYNSAGLDHWAIVCIHWVQIYSSNQKLRLAMIYGGCATWVPGTSGRCRKTRRLIWPKQKTRWKQLGFGTNSVNGAKKASVSCVMSDEAAAGGHTMTLYWRLITGQNCHLVRQRPHWTASYTQFLVY